MVRPRVATTINRRRTKMKKPMNKHRLQKYTKGSAVAFVLMALMIATIAAAFTLRNAGKKSEIAQASSQRDLLTIKARAHMTSFRDRFQVSLDALMLGDEARRTALFDELIYAIRIEDAPDLPMLGSADRSLTGFARLFAARRFDAQMECLRNCNLNSQAADFPKIFQVRYFDNGKTGIENTVRGEQVDVSGVQVVVTQTWTYAQQTLKDFAQLVLEQRQPLTIAPGAYAGKLGFQWRGMPAGNGFTDPPANAVTFNNTPGVGQTSFRDSIYLSNGLSEENLALADPDSAGPTFSDQAQIVAGVAPTSVSDLVANIGSLRNSDLVIPMNPIQPLNYGVTEELMAQEGLLTGGVESALITGGDRSALIEGRNSAILSVNRKATLVLDVGMLDVGGVPGDFKVFINETYLCGMGATCPGESNTVLVPPTRLSRKAILDLTGMGELTVVSESNAQYAYLPKFPFTVLTDAPIYLMQSLIQQDGESANTAFFTTNSNIIIPDNAKAYQSGTLLDLANNPPINVTGTGFEIQASLIAPMGSLVAVPGIIARGDDPATQSRSGDLGKLALTGLNVVNDLSRVSRQVPSNNGAQVFHGFSSKTASYPQSLLSLENQFPGALIQASGFVLLVTSESLKENLPIEKAERLLSRLQ